MSPLASNFLVPGGTYLFDVVALLLVLALVLGFIFWMLVRIGRSGHVDVQEDISVAGPASVVGRELDQQLSGLRLAEGRVRLRAPGQPAVVVQQTPAWTLIPFFLLFPIGALALLVKEDVVLEVFSFDSGGGTTVRLSGRTSKPVLAQVRGAVSSLRTTTVS